jgi:hypothetical protein
MTANADGTCSCTAKGAFLLKATQAGKDPKPQLSC